VDPTARAGGSLELRLGAALVLGIRATVEYWIRRQHFLVQGALVGEMIPWAAELGLYATSWAR
jgi:hypothetical protein